MKLNYILSNTTKGATRNALINIVKKAEENLFSNYIVIVPETKSIIIEKELLNLSSRKALANVYVYSFVRLISRLGFVDADKIVNKQTCVLLLRKIILENYDNLKCYKKTAKTIGFAEKMYETLQQFKSSNITVDDLKLSLQTKSLSLKAKLQDIIFLYEEYQKELGNKLYDDCDKLGLIKQFVKTSDFVKDAEVFVVGFDNITFEMQSVLKDIAVSAKETTFSCVYFNEKRRDKHIQTNELFHKFIHIANELKIPYVPTFYGSHFAGDFYQIAQNLYSTESKEVKSKGDVIVFEAKDKKQEIDYIANQILLSVKNGKRFKDVGLFACDLENNKKIIEDTFSEYEIPYFINVPHSISGHFFIKFIENSFKLFTTNLRCEEVLEFLSSPILSVKDFGVFQNFVYEKGLNYLLFLKYDLTKISSQDENKNSIIETFGLIRDFYEKLSTKIKTAKCINDYINIVQFIIEYFDVEQKLKEIYEFENSLNLKVDAEVTSQIYDKYLSFVSNLSTFMGVSEIDVNEFVQLLLTGFDMIKLNLSPLSIDCVIVQDNTDGFYGVKEMFIFDAVEGKFPNKLQDTGVILDSELEETKVHIKMPVEPTVKEINARENFRVYEALLEPSEKLHITYSRQNLDGGVIRPSRVILRILNLFGNDVLKKNNYERLSFVNYKNFEKQFSHDVCSYLNDEINLTELNAKYNLLAGKFSENYDRFLKSLSFGEQSFDLENVNGLYFSGDKTSVSQLETYFSCPYKYFANYGLRLKENKKANLNAIDIGLILHGLAESFANQILSFKNLSEEELDNKVDELLKQVLEKYEINFVKNKSILNLLSGEARRLCRHIFNEQKNSGFKILMTEFSFFGDNEVTLNLDDGKKIKIEGKIDRVDCYKNYIRLIDYKTGDIKSDLSSVYFGKKVQLISYLSAITNNQKIIKSKTCSNEKLTDEDLQVAGLLYLPIHSEFASSEKLVKDSYKMEGFLLDDIDVVKNMDFGLSFENNESHYVPLKIKTNAKNINENKFEISRKSQKFLNKEEFENIRNYTERLCANAASEILSGYIEPSPLSLSSDGNVLPCVYCSYAGFCGLEKAKFSKGRVCGGSVSSKEFKVEDWYECELDKRTAWSNWNNWKKSSCQCFCWKWKNNCYDK